jgi:hypothetical protein
MNSDISVMLECASVRKLPVLPSTRAKIAHGRNGVVTCYAKSEGLCDPSLKRGGMAKRDALDNS